jgi:splicing factor, proline- and glutamine-rich
MEQLDDEDGFSERAFAKKTPDFLKERDIGPRFADPNSFQFTYGQRWKQLLELYKQKKEAVERELKMEEEKLISQMEYARYEHETEQLRERKSLPAIGGINSCEKRLVFFWIISLLLAI